ncbi:MAG: PEP-CTERM sorting domain-containing protein [Gammaproteobacteria bacterium]|nr:PEP-CTERM sorting domain-containing protein [Gammaproteobacteria bacterium]
MRKFYTYALVVFFASTITITQANLLKNSSFEDTTLTGTITGQGNLPDYWVNIAPPTPTADTYSNDGSFGVSPSAYGNFSGVTAYDGNQWVAGWSASGQESFGQYLDTSLTLGATYEFSGWLHQAVRPDLNNPGGYEIFLTDTPGIQDEYLGFLGSTGSVSQGWLEYSFTFSVTDAMSDLTFLEFGPIATAAGSAYPGLDMVSLTQVSDVPEPAIIALFTAGLFGIGFARRRKA